jgi:hypothetical protein
MVLLASRREMARAGVSYCSRRYDELMHNTGQSARSLQSRACTRLVGGRPAVVRHDHHQNRDNDNEAD